MCFALRLRKSVLSKEEVPTRGDEYGTSSWEFVNFEEERQIYRHLLP